MTLSSNKSDKTFYQSLNWWKREGQLAIKVNELHHSKESKSNFNTRPIINSSSYTESVRAPCSESLFKTIISSKLVTIFTCITRKYEISFSQCNLSFERLNILNIRRISYKWRPIFSSFHTYWFRATGCFRRLF